VRFIGCRGGAIELSKLIKSTSTNKAKLARHAGCDHVINYSSEDFVAEALAFTAGNGVAAVFDAKSFGQVSKCVEMSKQRRDCSNAAALASAPGEITGALMDAARDLQPS
jgi:NADPH:quinone reductase-like Zn-dependent oxidoreductase